MQKFLRTHHRTKKLDIKPLLKFKSNFHMVLTIIIKDTNIQTNKAYWNPSIQNIIRWFAGPMGQTNCGQSIWRSKYFFSSVVSYKLRALIPLYFHFCNFYEKKIRLGTSEAWLMKRLSRRPSEPGYYILDCRIFALYMAWNFISGASYYWVGGLELLLFLFEPRRKLSNQPKLPL